MQSIGEFFKRIGGVQAKEMALRGSIQGAIKELADIDVPITEITFKSGIVALKNISHGARSVIFIKKQKIIEKLNSVLESNQQVVDIR